MSKIYKFSAISLVVFGVAFSSLAQNSQSSPSPSPMRVREEIRETNREIQEMREEASGEMQGIRQTTRMRVEDERQEMLQRMEQIRETLRTRIEAKRVELRNKLKNIRDTRKSQTVEKIDKSMDDLNERMTDHFLSALDQLENILVRIGERADRSEESGVDVSSVRSAIETARDAISEARTAIESQAGKTYNLAITTEDKLKTDVGKARQQLHDDLKSVFELLKSARNAVHDAARAFAEANGRNVPEPSPSSSPTESPSVSASPSPTV